MGTSRLTIIFKNQMSIEEVYQLMKKRIQFLNKKRGNSINDKGNYIKKYLPQVYEDTIQRANLAMDGMLVLPGTFRKPYFVGNPPIWDSNPVNDLQYRSHLNRMEHWMDLLQAYTLTKEKKYAQKVLQELEDFINSCKRPDINEKHAFQNFNKPTPWKAIQVGIRMYRTWPWIIYHLMEDDRIPIEIFEKFCLSVYEHGEVLSTISSLLWPQADHNHYIMEMLGLLTIGCLFQEFKIAESWTKQAICELERCCKNQITSQGGQIEGCPSYHNGCVGWLCLGIYIAEENNYHFSEEFYKRIKKSMEYSIYSFRPCGTGVPWGDSSANKGSIVTALNGYLVFKDLKWLQLIKEYSSFEEIKKICHAYVWRINNIEKVLVDIKTVYQILIKNNQLPLVNWQKELKQVMMRNHWGKDAISIFFACRTPIKNNHAHIDPMSFDLTAYGRPLIVDPGRYTYREDEDRRAFKSAEYHNTVVINDKSPFEYIASWKYGPQNWGGITKVECGSNIMYAEACHLNYEPTEHRRLIGIIEGQFVLVLDWIKNVEKNANIKLYYHLDSSRIGMEENYIYTINNKRTIYKEQIPKGTYFNKSIGIYESKANVSIFYNNFLQPQILKGKISDTIDIYRDSIRLCLEDQKGGIERTYCSVIFPQLGNVKEKLVSQLESSIEDSCFICSFKTKEKSYKFCWNQDGLKRRE